MYKRWQVFEFEPGHTFHLYAPFRSCPISPHPLLANLNNSINWMHTNLTNIYSFLFISYLISLYRIILSLMSLFVYGLNFFFPANSNMLDIWTKKKTSKRCDSSPKSHGIMVLISDSIESHLLSRM
jgi:hypothetical protein